MKNHRFNWLAPAAAFVAGAIGGWKVGDALNSVVVNGGHMPSWETNQAIAYSHSVMLHGGLNNADAQTVVGDMHAVVNQARTAQRSYNYNNQAFR